MKLNRKNKKADLKSCNQHSGTQLQNAARLKKMALTMDIH
jgi:hypothetical protein